MIPLLLVLRVVAAFNHTHERAEVLTRNARIPDFSRCWQQERSQMYFQPTRIRFAAGEIVVEADANRFGLGGKYTTASTFVLKKEGADWKVDSLRVSDACLSAMQ